MKIYTILLGYILFSTTLFGQVFEGPYGAITNGYGSFGAHPIAVKVFDNNYLLNHGFSHGDGGVEISIRYASDIDGPMPTVLFAPGWSQYNPATFDKLLDLIASKGYCVVFSPYPTDQSNSSWETSLYEGMNQAIHENSGENLGDDNIIDKTRIGIFGHSLGAGDVFWLGHKFFVDHEYGSNAKFIYSVAGWIGFNMTQEFLDNYPSDCKLRIDIWEEDDHDPASNPPGNTSPRIQYYLFDQINIPSSEKNYVKVLGGPDVNGYHYSTHHDLVTMSQFNALDYYAIFRPIDAMMDYVFEENPDAKNIALGFDPDMGPFPDLDTDYNTFVFAYNEDTYEYPCDVPGNPFKDECPSSPSQGGITLNVKTILQGPYNDATQLMDDNLRSDGSIPLAEPFTALGFNHVLGGGETTTQAVLNVVGSNAIVDWIFVELREASAPNSIIATQSALLQRDGDIVDVDGNNLVTFTDPNVMETIVVLRHRNHLGIRTLDSYLTNATITVDFTNPATNVYGQQPMIDINGKRAMIAGDANQDGYINAVDKNGYWQIENGNLFDYLNNKADYNLDGITNPVDRNEYWRVNFGKVGVVE